MDIEIDYRDYDEPSDVYQHIRVPERHGFTDDDVLWTEHPTYHEQTNASYDTVKSGHGKQQEVYQRVRYSPKLLFKDAGDNCRFWNAAMHRGSEAAGGIPGDRHTGTDGWSVRLYTRDYAGTTDGPFGLTVYLYHMDMEGTYGTEDYVDEPLFDFGGWHTLETFVRNNTVSGETANADGEVRIWVDGSLVYERNGLRFDALGTQGGHVMGPVMKYGGRELPPETVRQYYDSHSINFGMPESSGFSAPACVRDIV